MAYLYRDNYPSNEIDIPHNTNQECCRQHVALNAISGIDTGLKPGLARENAAE